MSYDVKPLVLARSGKIPDDASVVVIAGPRSDLFGPELDALDAYVGRGGKLLVMLDPAVRPGQQEPEALKRFLGKYGIQPGNNVVIEANPLTHLVDLFRRAFTLHQAPPPSSVLYLTVFCLLSAGAGAALFARARPHFADLI